MKIKIETLISMGFDKEQAINALEIFNGDLDESISYLLNIPDNNINVSINNDNNNNNVNNSTNLPVQSISNDEIIDLGISQYSFKGIGNSSCTSIACSVVYNLLIQLENGITIKQLKDNINLFVDCINEGVNNYLIIQNNQSVEHLSIDDVYDNNNDMKEKLVKVNDYPLQGLLYTNEIKQSSIHFENLFNDIISMSNNSKYIGIVLTKPPETISIIIAPTISFDYKYMLIDSHSRPQFDLYNAYVVVFYDLHSLINRLCSLFPAIYPERGYQRGSNEYMLAMYNSFEVTVFQLKDEDIKHFNQVSDIILQDQITKDSEEKLLDDSYVIVDKSDAKVDDNDEKDYKEDKDHYQDKEYK